jgi:hypothetical protein
MIKLLRIGLWIGAAAYTAVKVNEKDFDSVREELQKKADEKETDGIREEMRRLQTSNALLCRCVVELQEERSPLKPQQQLINSTDIVVQDPAPSSEPAAPCSHEPEGETGRGGGYLAGSWAQGGGSKRN